MTATATEGGAPAAAKSSFYAGMRVLPRAEREAMYGIYAFCRAVDDIADDPAQGRALRRLALDRWRRDLDALYRGRDAGQAEYLRTGVERFGLARADFEAVIDGMATDVAGDVRYPDMAALDLYVDRVAGAVGRLSVRVFGMAPAPGRALAFHLGRALQFTNILRDLDEDAAAGRLYLPRELLEEAGVQLGEPATMIGDHRIDAVCRRLAAMAHLDFAAADEILRARPKGHLIAPRLMAAAYEELLRRMERAGWKYPRRHVRHNRLALFLTLLRLKLGL